MIVAF